jgi:tetratricopeptide (TPR) repeat protein
MRLVNWKTILTLTVLLCVATPLVRAQSVSSFRPLPYMEEDDARDIFNEGRRLYDQNDYLEAEQKFQEVIRRFPDNAIADRTAYYLIRTLVRRARASEALTEIAMFPTRYPGSRWATDVQEEQLRLTNQLPRTRAYLAPAPPAPPVPRAQQAPPALPAAPVAAVGTGVERAIEQSMRELERTMRAANAGVRMAEREIRGLQGRLGGVEDEDDVDPEVSLQQEIMSAMLRNDPERAMEIAAERLAADPSDPVVLANFHMIARSDTEAVLIMLENIAKNSDSEKARRDAIFWISRWDGDESRVVDVLVNILPSITDDETAAAVAFSLSRVDSADAVGALVTIANDQNRNEELRKSAVFHITRTDIGDPIDAFRQIYQNASDSEEIRKQVTFALSRVDDESGAVTLLGEIARNDQSTEVRKQAVFWLGRMDSPEAMQILGDLLRPQP